MSRQYDDSWRDHVPQGASARAPFSRVAPSGEGVGASPKRSKYGAVATTVAGRRFDSKREAARWQELQLRVHAGEIGPVECQRAFPLVVTRRSDGLDTLIATWVADFVYQLLATGALVVEDAKGVRTREYLLKKKLFEALYALPVVEV